MEKKTIKKVLDQVSLLGMMSTSRRPRIISISADEAMEILITYNTFIVSFPRQTVSTFYNAGDAFVFSPMLNQQTDRSKGNGKIGFDILETPLVVAG